MTKEKGESRASVVNLFVFVGILLMGGALVRVLIDSSDVQEIISLAGLGVVAFGIAARVAHEDRKNANSKGGYP